MYSYFIITSCTHEGGISINGKLPWKYKEDMSFFRKTTIGDGNNVVIMGRKTYFSIPEKYRPLKNRINIVLTHEPQKYKNIVTSKLIFTDSYESIFHIIDNLIDLGENIDNVFNIGGKELYTYAINDNKLKGIYLTRINKYFETDEYTKCNFFEKEYIGETKNYVVNCSDDFKTMLYIFEDNSRKTN